MTMPANGWGVWASTHAIPWPAMAQELPRLRANRGAAISLIKLWADLACAPDTNESCQGQTLAMLKDVLANARTSQDVFHWAKTIKDLANMWNDDPDTCIVIPQVNGTVLRWADRSIYQCELVITVWHVEDRFPGEIRIPSEWRRDEREDVILSGLIMANATWRSGNDTIDPRLLKLKDILDHATSWDEAN